MSYLDVLVDHSYNVEVDPIWYGALDAQGTELKIIGREKQLDVKPFIGSGLYIARGMRCRYVEKGTGKPVSKWSDELLSNWLSPEQYLGNLQIN